MSFTDLMSSGRGPGVIGMLMALLVMVGFGALFVFAFDERLAGGDQSIESQIAQQAKEIDYMENVVANGRKTLDGAPQMKLAANELSDLTRGNQTRAAQIDGLNKSLEEGRDNLAAKSGEFEKYKDAYRAFVRGNAKGEVLERLETRSGKTYENITIREVTAIGMQIRHSDGFTRIPFEDLGDEIQERFQFDPKQKERALAAEAEARKLHEAAVSATRKKFAGQKAEQRQQAEQAEMESNQRAVALLESRIQSMGQEIENLQRAIFAEQNKTISHAPQMRESLAAKQRSLASMRAEVARLRSKL